MLNGILKFLANIPAGANLRLKLDDALAQNSALTQKAAQLEAEIERLSLRVQQLEHELEICRKRHHGEEQALVDALNASIARGVV